MVVLGFRTLFRAWWNSPSKNGEKCQKLMLLQVARNRCCCFFVDAVTIDVAIVVVAVGLSEKL